MTGTDRIEPRAPIEPPARPAVSVDRDGAHRGPGQGRSRRQPPAPPSDAEPEVEEDAPPPSAGRIDVIV